MKKQIGIVLFCLGLLMIFAGTYVPMIAKDPRNQDHANELKKGQVHAGWVFVIIGGILIIKSQKTNS